MRLILAFAILALIFMGYGTYQSPTPAKQSAAANESAPGKTTSNPKRLLEDNDAIDLPEKFSITLSWHGQNNYPIVDGATDLPDGVTLVVIINRPVLPNAAERLAQGLPACAVNCSPAVVDWGQHPDGSFQGSFSPRVKVHAGRFSVGPFSFEGAPFPAGVYPVQVFLPVGRLPETTSVSERVDRRRESFTTPVHKAYLTIR